MGVCLMHTFDYLMMHMCAHIGRRTILAVVPQVPSSLCFETGFLLVGLELAVVV